MNDAFLPTLLDTASAAYRPDGRIPYYFVRGKLAGDPLYRQLLQRGLFPPHADILDLGCGKALLASWLLAAEKLYACGIWPPSWPAPPCVRRYRGIERMARDVDRAHAAFSAGDARVDIVRGDIAQAEFGAADTIMLLDVLHYLDYTAQENVLQKVRAALPPGGRLLARVGDAGAGLPHRLSTAVDRAIARVRGHRLPRLYCRPLEGWISVFEALGFSVGSQPLGSSRSFANVMLTARLPR